MVAKVEWRDRQDIAPQEIYKVPEEFLGLHRVSVFSSMIGGIGGVRPFIKWFNADNSLEYMLSMGTNQFPLNVLTGPTQAVILPRPGAPISLGVDEHYPDDYQFVVYARVESLDQDEDEREGQEGYPMTDQDLVYLAAAELHPPNFGITLWHDQAIRDARRLLDAVKRAMVTPLEETPPPGEDH